MADLRTRIEQALGTGYRIERELGGGGMSRVFLAEETALGRRVVAKVLPPEMAATVNAERFQREIRTVAALHHPNIVALISAGGVDDLLWFTMPFVEGESLRARLTREGELPIGDAVRIWGEMLDALSYAHERGTVHRDIKPENVLLSGRHGLVADFGVSKALASATGDIAATATGLAIGTPAYMAPEQAAADPSADHRGDIYSAGLVMYEMLTGRSPFADRSPVQQLAAHATVPPPPIRDRREQVSPALESLVLSCLAKRPADRPQSAESVLQALSAVPDVTPGTATTSGRTGTAPTFSGAGTLTGAVRGARRRWVLAAAGLVVAAGGFLGFQKVTGRGGPLGAIPDSARVAVMVMPTVFDPADSLLARSAAQTIISRLANDRRLWLNRPDELPLFGAALGLSPEQVTRDSLLRWIPDMGVRAHLTLTIARAGNGYLVSTVIQGVERDSALLNAQLAAETVAEVPAVVEEMAERSFRALTSAFGRIASPLPNGALLRTTPDAARLLLDAMQAFERRDYLAAADRLRNATRIDSTSAIAWLMLSFSLSNAGVQTDERIRAMGKAFELRDRVPFRNGRLSIEADYYRTVFDDARALDAYSRLEREFGAQGGNNNLGLLYQRQRRFEDARRLFARVRDSTFLTPSVANPNYTVALIDLGRFEEAERELYMLDSVAGPENPNTRIVRFQLLRAQRNKVDSIAIIARQHLESARTTSQRLSATLNLRDALLARGELAEAERIQQMRARMLDTIASTRLGTELFDARWRLILAGDSAGAVRRVDDALKGTDIRSLAPMDRPYSAAITTLATIGRIAEARRLSEEWEREIPNEFKPIFRNGIEYARGEIALAERDGRRALVHFRNADTGACTSCTWPEVARAFDALGNADSSLFWFERYVDVKSSRQSANDALYLAAAYRRAGELLEAKGDLRKAIQRYQQYIELRRDADPELQPQVEDVKARVARLQARIG